MQLELGPLSPSQTKEIVHLKAAYGRFWRRFPKGYKEPSFSRKDVEGILSQAAEIVVRIRSHLDKLNPDTATKRVLSGSCAEYLFDKELEIAEPPSTHPQDFLRGIVRATLRDAHGYVEGLTEELIDSCIDQVLASYNDPNLTAGSHTNVEKGENVFRHISKQWERCQTLLGEAFSTSATERAEMYDPSTLEDMENLLQLLESTENTLRAVRMNRMRTTRSAFLDPPPTPFLSCRDDEQEERQEPSTPLPTSNSTPPTLHSSEDTSAPSSSSTSSSSSSSAEKTPSLTDDSPSTSEPSPTPDSASSVEESTSTSPVDTESLSNTESTTDSTSESTSSSSTSPSTVVETTSDHTTSDDSPSTQTQSSEGTENTAGDDGQEDGSVQDDSEDQGPTILEISRVAEHVDQVAAELKQFLGKVEPLCADEASLALRPFESLKEIERMHSTVIGHSEDLLQDLLHLDALEVNPETRQERKKQVLAIQSLMDDLDGIANKLKRLRNMLKAEVAKAQPEQSSSSSSSSSSTPSSSSATTTTSSPSSSPSSTTQSRTSTPPPSATQQSPSSNKPQPPPTSKTTTGTQQAESTISSLWEKMKLELEWERDANPRAYLIRAFVPGVDTKKIKIELSQDASAFTVSGARTPSAKEESELRLLARRRFRYPPSEEDAVIMQLGHGKYGAFKNTFSLPKDAAAEQISATYERGILQIEVPRKRVAPPAPVPQREFDPFRQFYGAGGLPPRRGGGFFDDRNIWW